MGQCGTKGYIRPSTYVPLTLAQLKVEPFLHFGLLGGLQVIVSTAIFNHCSN